MPIVLAVVANGDCFGIFFSPIVGFLFFLPRYRLKCRLKGSLNINQLTDQLCLPSIVFFSVFVSYCLMDTFLEQIHLLNLTLLLSYISAIDIM